MAFKKLGKPQVSEFEWLPCVKTYFDTLRLDKSKHTLDSYIRAIDKFLSFVDVKSTKDLDAITYGQGLDFLKILKNEGKKVTSVNAYLRPIQAFFNWLLESQYITNNSLKKIKLLKEPHEKRAFMTVDEFYAFFNACKNTEEKTMFSIFMRTGIRNSELINIKLEDVDGDVIFISGKGNKEGYVSLPKDTYELLEDHIKIRNKKYGNDVPYLFVSKMGKKYTRQSISYKFKAIMRRAGFSQKRIGELHVHSLRHSFLAIFLENGGDIKVAQKILRHSKMATTAEIYAHLRDSALLDIMRNQKPLFQ